MRIAFSVGRRSGPIITREVRATDDHDRVARCEMGNASEAVRRQAMHVTDPNAEEGFATAIERYVMPWAVPAPQPGPD